MEIKHNSKKVEIRNVVKVSEIGKVRGLMFRRRENCPSLLFEFKKPIKMKIHSLFVFFPFLALWLDENNNVLDKRIVRPWKISVSPSVKKYSKLLEIPFNVFYSSKVKSLVGQKV